MLPKALKSCPKSNKSPNLVTQALLHKNIKNENQFWQICRRWRQQQQQQLDEMTIKHAKLGIVGLEHETILRHIPTSTSTTSPPGMIVFNFLHNYFCGGRGIHLLILAPQPCCYTLNAVKVELNALDKLLGQQDMVSQPDSFYILVRIARFEPSL